MSRLRLVVIVLASLALAACGASAPRSRVAPDATRAAGDLSGQLRVLREPAGTTANALWTPELDGVGFNTLLERRLTEAGLLAADAASAPYTVSAELLRLDQPLEGINYEVKCKVNYRVTGATGSRELPILSTGGATVLDHVVATRRLAIASERAVEANIRAFIAALAAP